jgi:hypothetical protein
MSRALWHQAATARRRSVAPEGGHPVRHATLIQPQSSGRAATASDASRTRSEPRRDLPSLAALSQKGHAPVTMRLQNVISSRLPLSRATLVSPADAPHSFGSVPGVLQRVRYTEDRGRRFA